MSGRNQPPASISATDPDIVERWAHTLATTPEGPDPLATTGDTAEDQVAFTGTLNALRQRAAEQAAHEDLPPYEAPTGEVEPEKRYVDPWALKYPEVASQREEE